MHHAGKVIGTLAMRLSDLPAPAPALPAQAPPSAAADDDVLGLIRIALAAPGFDESAGGVATELAKTFACDRVFLGMTARRFVQVKALSHGARIGHEQGLARAVGAAMDEAVDQGVSILYP